MKKLLTLVVLITLVSACVKDNLDNTPNVELPSDKIFYASESAAKGHLLVKLDAPIDDFCVEGLDLKVEPLFRGKLDEELSRWLLVSFDESLSNAEVAEAIAKDSRVIRIEYDVLIKPIKGESLGMQASRPEITRSVEMPFNDPELPNQWHYNNDGTLDDEYSLDLCFAGADINLFNAWKYTAGDNRVIVAVCDSGIMTDHPDLADNMWVNEAEKNGQEGVDDDGNGYIDDVHGYNFVSDTGKVTADSHGTHVAGTISAVNNNGFAVSGIAGGTGNGDGVRLMSIQIFEGENVCNAYQIANAIKYAADNGAVIINNSWGTTQPVYSGDNEYEYYDSLKKDALDYFKKNAKLEGTLDGGIVIFAAGNERYKQAAYPGAYRDYICVAAISSDYTAAYYTNCGNGVNICAPGGDPNYANWLTVLSTSVENANTTGSEYNKGTSMACPHVAGCAALAVSYALKKGYTLTADELHNLILTSVHDINQHQVGEKYLFDYDSGEWSTYSAEVYKGLLGSGYIDAHLLLMQMDNTPCLYLSTGASTLLSLNEYFGSGSSGLNYDSVDVSEEVRTALGIETLKIENGMLRMKANNPGSGRIKVKAIVGGDHVGGDTIGGSYVEREFEVVVRGAKAENGGWL